MNLSDNFEARVQNQLNLINRGDYETYIKTHLYNLIDSIGATGKLIEFMSYFHERLIITFGEDSKFLEEFYNATAYDDLINVTDNDSLKNYLKSNIFVFYGKYADFIISQLNSYIKYSKAPFDIVGFLNNFITNVTTSYRDQHHIVAFEQVLSRTNEINGIDHNALEDAIKLVIERLQGPSES